MRRLLRGAPSLPLGSVLVGIGLTLTVGCASPSRVDRDVSAALAEGECFPLMSVRSFSTLDDRRILVDTRPQKIIEVYADCEGLRFAQDVAIEGRAGNVCDYRGDKLIVDGRRCTIASINDYVPASEDGEAGEADSRPSEPGGEGGGL